MMGCSGCRNKVPLRLLGGGCDPGLENSVMFPPHFPLCSVGRIGGWSAICDTCLPYPPDTWTIEPVQTEVLGQETDTALGRHELGYFSPCLWRSQTMTRKVVLSYRLNALTIVEHVVGITVYYIELDLTDITSGQSVLRRITLSHPRSDFPELIEWTNPRPLSESSVFTLVGAEGLSRWLNPDGLTHAVTWTPGHADVQVATNRPRRGDIPCAWNLVTGSARNGLSCLDVVFSDAYSGPHSVTGGGSWVARGYDDPDAGLKLFMTGLAVGPQIPTGSAGILRVEWSVTCEGVVVRVRRQWSPSSGNVFEWFSSGVLAFDWYNAVVMCTDESGQTGVTCTVTICGVGSGSGIGVNDGVARCWDIIELMDDFMEDFLIARNDFSLCRDGRQFGTEIETQMWEICETYQHLDDLGCDPSEAKDWFDAKWEGHLA